MPSIARVARSAFLPAVFAAVFGAGCGDDHSHGEGGGSSEDRPTCEQIGELCHDSTTTLGQECHEFGEDAASTEADCKARQDECKAECS